MTDPSASAASSEPVTVIRSEERLAVTTVRTAAERVRIRRVIVTEERTITVQVRREELVLEREPLDGSAALSGDDVAEPITIVLHAEEPVVSTRVVPVERVHVVVDRVVQMRSVSEAVRRERVEIERSVAGLVDDDAV
jgi:uncharacterized protein (TIGR02271 family)